MAKLKRTIVGSVLNPTEEAKKQGKGAYIRLRGDNRDMLLEALAGADTKKGLTLILESKQQQLNSFNDAVANGRIPADKVDYIKNRIEKIPDYVKFEIVLLSPA